MSSMDSNPMKVLLVSDRDSLNQVLDQVRSAHNIYKTYSQKQVNAICAAVSKACSSAGTQLAEAEHRDTGMGDVPSKYIKAQYAAVGFHDSIKHQRTCDEVSVDQHNKVATIAAPVGIVGCFAPVTSPISTIIYKSILNLKTRNACIFSPFISTQESALEVLTIINDAAVGAGAPSNLFAMIYKPLEKLTPIVMQHPSIDILLVTGGRGMVKHAYSSGKPALGAGSGNVPAILDESCDMEESIHRVLASAVFDYGSLCSSEEALLYPQHMESEVMSILQAQGVLVLGEEECQTVGAILRDPITKALNPAVVGRSPAHLMQLAGIEAANIKHVRCLCAKVSDTKDISNPWLYEKLSSTMALIPYTDRKDATAKAQDIISYGGKGHSCVLHINMFDDAALQYSRQLGLQLDVGRLTINSPGCLGTTGGIFNFGVPAGMSISTGTWGGNYTSENVSPKHLLNYKLVSLAEDEISMVLKGSPVLVPAMMRARAAVNVFLASLEIMCKSEPGDTVFSQAKEVANLCYRFFRNSVLESSSTTDKQTDIDSEVLTCKSLTNEEEWTSLASALTIFQETLEPNLASNYLFAKVVGLSLLIPVHPAQLYYSCLKQCIHDIGLAKAIEDKQTEFNCIGFAHYSNVSSWTSHIESLLSNYCTQQWQLGLSPTLNASRTHRLGAVIKECDVHLVAHLLPDHPKIFNSRRSGSGLENISS